METSAEPDKQTEEEQGVAGAPAAEAAQPIKNEADAAPEKPKSSPDKSKGRRASKASHKNQPTPQQVMDRFAACGRCSYFWAGYRVVFGETAVKTAVAQSQSGWLNLEWSQQMPELVYKSYGARLDIAHYHYEGSCKECRRRYGYHTAESDEEAATFRIEISPGNAR